MRLSAAARNDPSPIFGVGFERLSLEWIDLIANDADDVHDSSSLLRSY